MFYIARTVDMLSGLRVYALKTTISIFVDSNEIARTFSIIVAIEAISQFVFVYAYTEVYSRTIESWPAAFFFMTLIVFVVCSLCFTYVGSQFLPILNRP